MKRNEQMAAAVIIAWITAVVVAVTRKVWQRTTMRGQISKSRQDVRRNLKSEARYRGIAARTGKFDPSAYRSTEFTESLLAYEPGTTVHESMELYVGEVPSPNRVQAWAATMADAKATQAANAYRTNKALDGQLHVLRESTALDKAKRKALKHQERKERKAQRSEKRAEMRAKMHRNGKDADPGTDATDTNAA